MNKTIRHDEAHLEQTGRSREQIAQEKNNETESIVEIIVISCIIK